MSAPRDSSQSEELENGHHHSTRNVFKYHKHGKPSQSSEVAPLLANGNDDNSEANGDPEDSNGNEPKGQKLRVMSFRLLLWIRRNIRLLAIILLLIAGVIALGIYLGSRFWSFFLISR